MKERGLNKRVIKIILYILMVICLIISTTYFAGIFIVNQELVFTNADSFLLSLYICGVIITCIVGVILILQNNILKKLIEQVLLNQYDIEDNNVELHKIIQMLSNKNYMLLKNIMGNTNDKQRY